MQYGVKFLTKLVAVFTTVAFLLFPLSVQALGFGNIKMNSALNEPLNAEIELISATADDIKALEVKLASREAFLRAGVDRSSVLSNIKFKIVKRGGKYYITLKTSESVREPFLNFLMEMNWKSGRMLREYTVLLDPPNHEKPRQEIAAQPEYTPPVAAIPEPVSAPAPTESPFIQPEPVFEPTAIAEAESDEPFPHVALDSPQQVPLSAGAVESSPAPIAAPETSVAPEPEPAPVADAVPLPDTLMAPSDSVAAAEPLPEEMTFDGPVSASESEGLYPQIPLSAYSEKNQIKYDEAPVDVPEPEMASSDELLGPDVTDTEVSYEPVGDMDYGITQKGDSLWVIANKVRPNDQVSVYQVMMALQKSNPDAFIDGNIHRLKPGQVMRIEDPSLLTSISKEQAAQEYQVQTEAWQDYLASVGASVPTQAIEAGDTTGQDTADNGSPVEFTITVPDDAQSGSVAGSDTVVSGSGDSAQIANLQQQADMARSDAETARQRNQELQTQLSDVQAEVDQYKNLINIRDNDLANLQRRIEDLEKGGSTSVAAADPVVDTQPIVEPEPVVDTPVEPDPTPVVDTPVEPVVDAEPIIDVEPVDAEPVIDVEPVMDVEPVQPTVTSTPISSSKNDGFLSIFDGYGIDPLYVLIGLVVIVLILILLIVVIIRRRRSVHFQESILTGGAENEGKADMDSSPSTDSSMMGGGESSFLSDFAISGVSAIQAEDSEVDPLTEADVFMAYGRYEAAEERLQEAINQDPNRGELRVKLLELYNTTKNKQGFETGAEDYYATLGQGAESDPLWQKVVAMGADAAPDNPMFSGSSLSTLNTDVTSSSTSDDINDSQVMDIGLDTGVFNTSDFTEGGTPSSTDEATDNDLDFNLGGSTPETAASDTTNDLDFSLDVEGDSTAETDTSASTSDDLDFSLDLNSDNDDDATGIDFSLDMDSSADSAPVAATETGADALDFNIELDNDEEPTSTDLDLGGDTSGSDSLNFDLNTDDSSSDAGMDMNLDASDAIELDMPSSGGDEVGTKLDLARAYIDMGDPDGARSILDEVIDEGSDGQKQEAQDLMTQIG